MKANRMQKPMAKLGAQGRVLQVHDPGCEVEPMPGAVERIGGVFSTVK